MAHFALSSKKTINTTLNNKLHHSQHSLHPSLPWTHRDTGTHTTYAHMCNDAHTHTDTLHMHTHIHTHIYTHTHILHISIHTQVWEHTMHVHTCIIMCTHTQTHTLFIAHEQVGLWSSWMKVTGDIKSLGLPSSLIADILLESSLLKLLYKTATADWVKDFLYMFFFARGTLICLPNGSILTAE